MKGYYKNWYQHYLEEEKEKERALKRGYYSNLPPKDEVVEIKEETNDVEAVLTEKEIVLSKVAVVPKKKEKKRRARLGSILLPLLIIVGFIGLWYHMDVGPTREWVDVALVWTGVREAQVDVAAFHEELLDAHQVFATLVGDFVGGDATRADEVGAQYGKIRALHQVLLDVSSEGHEELVRLWSFKIFSTNQMMSAVHSGIDVELTYEQFLGELEEVGGLILLEMAQVFD